MRGKKFRSAHVDLMLTKRLVKEELLNREDPPMCTDFRKEVLDKTILIRDFGFPAKHNGQ